MAYTPLLLMFSAGLGFLCLLTLSVNAAAGECSGPPIRRRSRHEALPRWKRVLDLFCLGFALPAVLPLCALVALAIKLCSRGPILFSQERIGFLGEPFQCLKFRTMIVDAETGSHAAHFEELTRPGVPMTKLDARRDPRIIPVGWLLRSTGLDELPQLINVVRGEMTLVGPRPCLRYEFEKYGIEARQRFNCIPGLTGLWQVSGKNNTTFQRMIELDIAYGRRMSLLCDLGILLRTPLVLFEQTSKAVRTRLGAEHSRVESPVSGPCGVSFAEINQHRVNPSGNQTHARPRRNVPRGRRREHSV